MESNPLRGLFGVYSPRPVEQRVAPQPTEPTINENVYFEIPSGMIEKLLANPFLGDGTKHPDEHLIYVDEVCGLFKLAGVPGDVVNVANLFFREIIRLHGVMMTREYRGSIVVL